MNITIVVSHLGGGGAEGFCVALAAALQKRGHTLTILTLSTSIADVHAIPPGVTRMRLGFMEETNSAVQAAMGFLRGNRQLRRTLLRAAPDCVISILDKINIHVAFALLATSVRHVASVMVHPRYCSLDRRWRLLRRVSYRWIDAVVTPTRENNRALSWLPAKKRHVIDNPLRAVVRDRGRPDRPDSLDPHRKWILAGGRLTRQKGFDILLDAFHVIHERFPSWDLMLLGEGELRQDIASRVRRLHLQDRVRMPGYIVDIVPYYCHCDLFVLSSRYEGTPLILVEALACGAPVISTRCPSGPAEVIENGVNGRLVPVEDAMALSAAMAEFMSDPAARSRCGAAARDLVPRFDIDRIAGQWETVMDGIVGATDSPTRESATW